MNSRTLAGASLAAIAAIVIAAVILFRNSDDSIDGAKDSFSGAASGTTSQSDAGIVRKLPTSELHDPQKKKPEIEKVDPQKYTTAPPAGSSKAKIFKLVMELGTPDAEKVTRLLAMMPGLSQEEKSMALDHATQLIPDTDYIRQRPTLLRLADTDELREVVLLDLLTRDDTIKMPGLVELMKQPHAIMKTEAREVLEAYLEQDHGEDTGKWDVAVRQWLAENAEI
jgi:hypothetical protein